MDGRVIVITAALASLPAEGPFAEYPFEITRTRHPAEDEDPALHTGFFGHAYPTRWMSADGSTR